MFDPSQQGILLRIQNGTPNFSASPLCNSCRFAAVAESIRERYVQCAVFNARVYADINKCNRYQDRATPSIHDMAEIAWELRTEKDRIGFFTAKSKQRSWDIQPSPPTVW